MAEPAEITRMSAAEIYKRVSPAMFTGAYKNGRSLSAEMEALDPSTDPNSPLDAFGRVMRVANIVTRTMPERGIYADSFGRFLDGRKGATEAEIAQDRALACEWIAREWRAAASGLSPSTRALYLSGDAPAGTIMRPYVDSARARYRQLAPAIPLSEIVAITSNIPGSSYRMFYLTDNTDEARMKRVAEGTDVPSAKLESTQHVIVLRKYGRALEMTYDQLREMQIDLVALHIARMAVQAESDKLVAAMNTLVAGDGNPNSAASVYNLTALHSAAVAGSLTTRGWLSFKLKFLSPYTLTTILAQEESILQALLLNLGTANVQLVQVQQSLNLGDLRPINPELSRQVGYGVVPDSPALKIVGFDNRLALEHITQIGASITEVDKFIRNQTNLLVMTEVEGFAVFDQFATKILNINA